MRPLRSAARPEITLDAGRDARDVNPGVRPRPPAGLRERARTDPP
jgi:hypothetical protein